MAKAGKIYYSDREFTDAEVASLFGFPVWIRITDGNVVTKDINYDETGAKSIALFNPSVDHVIAVGDVTANSSAAFLSVHPSGSNKVQIGGAMLTKDSPNTFPFTPVTTGSKFLIIVAKNAPGLFFLKEGIESSEAKEPTLDEGELFVRRLLITPEGADIDPETLSGYIEKREAAWKSVVLTSAGNYSLPFSADDNISNFFITKRGTNIQTITGIDKSDDADKAYDGREFLIFNYAGTDIILDSTSGNASTQWLFLSLQTPITLKARQSARVKLKNGILYVIQSSGGGADFPETGSNGDVLVKDDTLTDGVKWKMLYWSMMDGYVTRWDGTTSAFVPSAIFNSSAGNIGIGTTTPGEKLTVNGNVKANQFIYNVTTANTVPNKTWTDGTDLWFTNGLGVNARMATDVQETIPVTGNLPLNNTHHGKILRITANCIITVPTGLRSDFIAFFIVAGNYTATFTEGSGMTFYKPFGNLLKEGLTCYLENTSASTADLIGNLTTT